MAAVELSVVKLPAIDVYVVHRPEWERFRQVPKTLRSIMALSLVRGQGCGSEPCWGKRTCGSVRAWCDYGERSEGIAGALYVRYGSRTEKRMETMDMHARIVVVGRLHKGKTESAH